jgi:cephalosporin hydroxylase
MKIQISNKDIYSEGDLQKRLVAIEERDIKSDLPASFWQFIAKDSCYVNWKGIPMQKDPFQIVTTQQLIQELKPKTIIEFGSFRGASALWLADIQSLTLDGGRIVSVDISDEYLYPQAKIDQRIEFILGDSNKVEQIFPPNKIASFLHPILLIEDAHINTVGILNHFHKNAFEIGDYLIVEDTNIHYNDACYEVWKKELDPVTCANKLDNLNNKIFALKDWLQDKDNAYLVDTKFTDPFSMKNATKNWNSVIKKVK